MNLIKAAVPHRLKAGIVIAALCASLFGAAGCKKFSVSFGESYIRLDNIRLGERTISWGSLNVFYRTTGGRSYNFPTTQLMLNRYTDHRNQGSNEWTSARLTLLFLRQFCGDGYEGDRCRDAMASDEASDFLYDSLVPAAWNGGVCIALHIRSGENWTYRDAGDRHCIPN